jgi:hypothetical protein
LALLVLAADSRSGTANWTSGSIAIDVASGALVRFLWDGDWPDLPKPYSLVLGTLADSQHMVFDPAQPEAVALSGELRSAGRLPAWRVGRYLRSLGHPRGRHLLGCAGPALPYWTFDGHRPSAALVDLEDGPVVLGGPRGLDGPDQLRCQFSWNGSTMDLPITDRRVAAALRRTGRPWLRGSSLARAVGGSPRHLVVAWSPPVEGHCYKVVAGILPRP